MHQLPEPPAAPAAGQTPDLSDAVLQAAVDHVIEEAKRRDTAPKVVIGTTPPVPQPGRPPMSQQATDVSALMLSGSVLTATLGGSATAILWASGHADPAVVAVVFGAPAFLALAIARLLKRAKDAAPPDVHHHYNGPVTHQTTHSRTTGVWAKTDNRQ
ncbi:hypothetical protein [Streptomyces sp. NPDC058291]|uniref:hypothetical protein n=1 Tax=Streptomyces sp. NPDC058291 TaxID=3346427 RepID=UPI0036ED6A85